MLIPPAYCLAIIMFLWLALWRTGRDWCRACGVNERFSQWSLACILPMAGLIVAVHLLALASLFTPRGYLTPGALTVVYAMIAWVAYGYVKRLPVSIAPCEFTHDRHRGNSHWWLPLGIVAAIYVVFVADAATRYPSGYDAVNYHLPMAFKWAREQAMNLVIDHSGYSWPDNGMIVPCLLAFAKAERLIPLIELPNGLLLGLTVMGFARTLGIGRGGAVVAVCVTMSVPIVVFQSFSGYIDLYAAVCWLMALLAVVWACREGEFWRQRQLIIMAGLAAGAALGAKSTYIVMTVLLAAIVVWSSWRIRAMVHHGTPLFGRILGTVGVFVVGAIACSGFWFVRGTVQAGNPFYPVVFHWDQGSVLPRAGIAAVDDLYADRALGEKAQHWATYPWRESKLGSGYGYGVDNGLGAAFATIVPVGFLCAFTRRRRNRGEVPWVLVFAGLSALGVVLLATVFGEMLRMALPFIVLAIIVSAYGLNEWAAAKPKSAAALLSIALIVTAGVATLRPAHSFLGRVRDDRWDRAWFYQVPELIDALDPGARIVNLNEEPMTYALLGKTLSNVPISYLHWSALTGGGVVTTDVLVEHDIDYLFMREPWPELAEHSLPVELIYDDTDSRELLTTPATRIYRVIGPNESLASAR